MRKKSLILAAGCFLLGLLAGVRLPKEMPFQLHRYHQANQWERMTPKPAKSQLEEKSRCWMCGNDARSLMGLYRGKDDLGVIYVNYWYVMPMEIRNLDEKGEPMPAQGMSTGMTTTSQGECSFETEKNPNRGISQVVVNGGEKSVFDIRKVQKHLCQQCLNKLLKVMEMYGNPKENPKPQDLCLVDFQTMELYSLQNDRSSYFIRDYYVQIEGGADKKITAVYAPDIREK